MLVQCLSLKGIASQVVILGGTAMKMVIPGKVIAREKSSARLIYLFCFGKSVFIQAISETVLSKFELLRFYWEKKQIEWEMAQNLHVFFPVYHWYSQGFELKSWFLEVGVVLEVSFCSQLFRLPWKGDNIMRKNCIKGRLLQYLYFL